MEAELRRILLVVILDVDVGIEIQLVLILLIGATFQESFAQVWAG